MISGGSDSFRQGISRSRVTISPLSWRRGSLSIAFILTFVLPQFEPLFRDAGKELPTATRIVMSAGKVIGSYGWALAMLLAAIAVGAKYILTRPDVRRGFDGFALRLPLVGDL